MATGYWSARFRAGWEAPDLKRDFAILALTGVLTWPLAVGLSQWENLWIPFLAGAGAVIGVELCGYLKRVLVDVPRDEYRDLQIARDALSSVAEQHATLAHVLDRAPNDWAKSVLLQHRASGVKLLQAPPLNDEQLERWRGETREWLSNAVRIMNENGCTSRDIKHVQFVDGFKHRRELSPNSDALQDVSMFAERLKRLADIASKYDASLCS